MHFEMKRTCRLILRLRAHGKMSAPSPLTEQDIAILAGLCGTTASYLSDIIKVRIHTVRVILIAELHFTQRQLLVEQAQAPSTSRLNHLSLQHERMANGVKGIQVFE